MAIVVIIIVVIFLLVLRFRVVIRFLLLRTSVLSLFLSLPFFPRTFSGLFPEPCSPSRVEMNSGRAVAL